MYNKNRAAKTRIRANESVIGESIENKMRRLIRDKEPIKDAAPKIYSERKEGVKPEYDIRTDKWEVAAEAKDRRQIRQQKRLNELEKGMTDYNMMKQLEMWEKTGYGATKEQMKKAGINPALLYGMGGGGGQSTNVATGHGGGNAPAGGGEIQGMMGIGLQAQMTQAQIRNIEADTKQKEAEAAATGGVKTDEGRARIEALQQGIENQKAQMKIIEVEESLKKMELFEQNATQEDRIDQIKWQAGKAMQDLKLAGQEAYVSGATMQEKVSIIKQAAVEAVLRNSIHRASKDKIYSDISVNNAQIEKIAKDIEQGWSKLNIDAKRMRIEKAVQEIKAGRPEVSEMIGEFLNDGLKGLDRLLGNERVSPYDFGE